MRALPIVLLALPLAACVSGCGLVSAGRSMTSSMTQLMKPNAKDYEETDIYAAGTDAWSQVGVEARGHQPMEHESDGLTRFVSSPKAQRINRNLGID